MGKLVVANKSEFPQVPVKLDKKVRKVKKAACSYILRLVKGMDSMEGPIDYVCILLAHGHDIVSALTLFFWKHIIINKIVGKTLSCSLPVYFGCPFV